MVGKLVHVEENCNEGTEEDTKGQYGDWLRASPIKTYRSNKNKQGGLGTKSFAEFECLAKITINLFILAKNAIKLTFYLSVSLNSIIFAKFATLTRVNHL